jgi:fructosamine-3-kinase
MSHSPHAPRSSPLAVRLMCALGEAIAGSLGRERVRIESATVLSGGSAREALRLVTREGEFFAKWSDEGPEDIFACEARGLDALRAVSGSITVPRVIAARKRDTETPGFLIIEYLPGGRGGEADDESLGRGLAAIHRTTRSSFGFDASSYCGPTAQDNRASVTWVEFYRERRLRPLVEALQRRSGLSGADRGVFDRLMERLEELLPADSIPSLIHGDLWAGNVLSTTRGPALVDPACAYGDREMEFGITALFGGITPRAFAAYEEAWPLRPDWRERNPLYQLYHLLNHALLFGGHYGGEALRVAARFTG